MRVVPSDAPAAEILPDALCFVGSDIDVSIPVPPGARYQAYIRKEPVGVVGAITPWNFPLNMACWKIAPALARGCTVVLKPTEETPLTAIRLTELCLGDGIPEGVVNVVTGTGDEAGAVLVMHPGVNKITFTGSTEVGKIIGAQAMCDMKRITLELGGKAPMIMFDDMDLDQLAAAAGIGIFFNGGQTCCAGSRIYAQKGIYGRVVDTIVDMASNLTVDSGLDPASHINLLVSAKHRSHVSGCIARTIGQGARPTVDAGPLRRRRLLREAGGLRGCQSVHVSDAGRDVRSRRGGYALRGSGRGDRARERHALRTGCLGELPQNQISMHRYRLN